MFDCSKSCFQECLQVFQLLERFAEDFEPQVLAALVGLELIVAWLRQLLPVLQVRAGVVVHTSIQDNRRES